MDNELLTSVYVKNTKIEPNCKPGGKKFNDMLFKL